MTAWFYGIDGQQFGPVDDEAISDLIAQGTIGPYTPIWRDGMGDWKPAASVLPAGLRGKDWPDSAPDFPPAMAAASTAQTGDHPSDFMGSVRRCFNQYAVFSGRARRPEYWYFVLFNMIAGFALGMVDVAIFGAEMGVSPLNSVYSLAVFVPSIAVGARRLHDIGRSGWWQLIMLIPLIGIIVLIVWFASKGEDTANDYGPA